jgi:hypothetical protein
MGLEHELLIAVVKLNCIIRCFPVSLWFDFDEFITVESGPCRHGSKFFIPRSICVQVVHHSGVLERTKHAQTETPCWDDVMGAQVLRHVPEPHCTQHCGQRHLLSTSHAANAELALRRGCQEKCNLKFKSHSSVQSWKTNLKA